MQKILIDIDINGAAFNENASLEISRIIKGLGYMFQDTPLDLNSVDMPLHDRLGNLVGSIKIISDGLDN